MRTVFFILTALIVSSAGCNRNLVKDGISADAKLVRTLKGSPQNLLIEGKTLTLQSELWRDFMPSVGKEERSLRAAVSISAGNDDALPANLSFNRLMVLKGDSIWVQTIGNSERSDNIRLKANTRGGPEWQPETTVDVVVEIKHNDKSYKLRQDSVQIRATY